MSWIKRNLYFFVGSVIAVALMGLAGWYLYSKRDLNSQIMATLNADYDKLKELNNKKPHPGNAKVDNIKAAREQQKELRGVMAKARGHFEPLARVPSAEDVPKLNDREFSSALSRTIDQLQRDATNASVILPANYSFSFEAQKRSVSFAQGSLEPLALQLGEVKAICHILFDAKINALDNLRRERVSADDANGPQSDYLLEHSVTNELAVLTPYEMTFRCFSSELASVLAGFASSPHGLIVKTINVEAAPPPSEQPETTPTTPTYIMPQVYGTTPYPPPQSTSDIMRSRYGIMGGGGGGYGTTLPGAVPYHGIEELRARQQQAYAQTVAPVAGQPAVSATGKGGLPLVLDEKQLKITLVLNLVKLLPPKKGE